MNHAFDISGHFARQHPLALAPSIASLIRCVFVTVAGLCHSRLVDRPFTVRVLGETVSGNGLMIGEEMVSDNGFIVVFF